MKRIGFALLFILCLLPLSLQRVQGAADRLVDEASLLTRQEETDLRQLLDETSQRQQVDIVIVTVDELDGASPMVFADDYYDQNGYGPDGILLLVSMQDRDWWVSTTGYGITAVTDAGLEYMSDQFVPYLSDGEYAQAFDTYARLCDEFLTQARTGHPYDSHNLPKEPFALGLTLIIALVIGLVVALIATGIMKGQLKSVRQQAKADDYVLPGSIRITRARDLFLYSHIDRREKPKQSGGSSTHMSASGRSHGGGGGRF